MTKTKLTQANSKPMRDSPAYTAVDVAGTEHQTPQSTTCWYVFGILSTIFCCLPCGVIGLVHAMIAKHEGERGNYAAHRWRLRQAKCWTSWSIVLGLLFMLAVTLCVIGMTGGFSRAYQWVCGTSYVDYFDYERWNATRGNDTDYYIS